MNKSYSLNKNIILISVISTLMVFWLSSSFWMDAYKERKSAITLEYSTQPEYTLFQLAYSIEQERSRVNSLLLYATHTEEDIDSLYEASANSNRLMQTAFEQVIHSREFYSTSTDYRYSDQAIQSTMDKLADGVERLSLGTSVVQLEIAMPPSMRDDATRLRFFDAYGRLLQEANALRHRSHFIPEKHSQNVIAVHELKNALWALGESISQNRALLEGFLVKSENRTLFNANLDGVGYRVYQQIQSAERSMFEFEEFFDNNSVDSELRDEASALTTWYYKHYGPYEKTILDFLTNNQSPTESIRQFLSVSDAMSSKIRKLSDQTINQTITSAQNIKNTAYLSLAVDTVLVLICIGMALASMNLSRNVQHQATHDDLTNLPNRRYFGYKLEKALSKVDGNQEKLALVSIDLDRFKSINDSMGHKVGDELLLQVAHRLSQSCKTKTDIARMGGDEFSILLKTDDASEIDALAQTLQQSLAEPFHIYDGSISIGASFGISKYPDDASTADALQITSDFAMYHAKSASMNKIQHYNQEMAERFENRVFIERDLGIAISEKQFELYYQPQLNVKMHRVDAVEALIRWHHPTRGFVPPDQFIEIAEEAGVMPMLGAWVLDEACRQIAVWNNEEGLNLRVAVNVSVHQVMQQDYVEQVFDTIERHGIEPSDLELEITESVVMADVDWVIRSLSSLKMAGIKIALDDFGTGYSSLSQLQDLPLDTLKIDRSFINKLGSSSNATHSFTATIAQLASTLGLETVAEGVESNIQCSLIHQLGIDFIQGYFYSKPVAGKDVESAIAQINASADQQQRAA